jgi:hypothetical protein
MATLAEFENYVIYNQSLLSLAFHEPRLGTPLVIAVQ